VNSKGQMHRTLTAVVSVLASILAFQNCGGFTGVQAPRASIDFASLQNKQCLDYSASLTDQTKILMANKCQSCHTTTSAVDGRNHFRSVFDVQAMVQSGDVTPGDAYGSLVYLKVANSTHPDGAGLNVGEVQLLKDWIDVGLAACPTPGPSGTPDSKAPSFANDTAFLFQKHNCLACHSTPTAAFGNVGLKNYSDVVKVINPNAGTQSQLYLELDRMSGAGFGSSPFSAAEKDLILKWINTGGNP
jgi:cytochrome c551/c552